MRNLCVLLAILFVLSGCAAGFGAGAGYPYPTYQDKNRPLSETSVVSVFYQNVDLGIQDTNIFQIDGVHPAIGGYGHWARVIPGTHEIVIAYGLMPKLTGLGIQMSASMQTVNIDMKARHTYIVEPHVANGKFNVSVKELPEGFVYVKPINSTKEFKAEY